MRADELIALLKTIPDDAEVKIWASPESWLCGDLALSSSDGVYYLDAIHLSAGDRFRLVGWDVWVIERAYYAFQRKTAIKLLARRPAGDGLKSIETTHSGPEETVIDELRARLEVIDGRNCGAFVDHSTREAQST